MSLGATGTEGTVDVGDAFAAGGSVHGPLRAFSGGFGSGAPGAGGAHQGGQGGPGVAAPGLTWASPWRARSSRTGSRSRTSTGPRCTPPPSRVLRALSGATSRRRRFCAGTRSTARRRLTFAAGADRWRRRRTKCAWGDPRGGAGSAYGGAYFENLGGARHGAQGSGAGGSVHGQSNLAGFKRGAADELGPWGPGSGSPGGDPAFGHMGGDGKRGSTWHGGDAAWHAMEGRNVGGPKGMHFQAFQAAGMHAGAGGGVAGGQPRARRRRRRVRERTHLLGGTAVEIRGAAAPDRTPPPTRTCSGVSSRTRAPRGVPRSAVGARPRRRSVRASRSRSRSGRTPSG